MSIEQASKSLKSRLKTLLAAFLFVLGFSAVFIGLGAAATVLGGWLFEHSRWFTAVGGVMIIILGLHIAGLIPLPFLSRQKKFGYKGKLGLIGAPIIGIVFAFGWSPCIGPVLAAILGMASMAETVNKGIILLVLYSAGLAIPFMLSAMAVEVFIKFYERIKSRLILVNIVAGKLLVAMGLLLFSGRFGVITGFGHLTWPVITAALGILLVFLLQIYLLVKVQDSLVSNNIETIPGPVTAIFFVDIYVIAALLFASWLIPGPA